MIGEVTNHNGTSVRPARQLAQQSCFSDTLVKVP